MPHRIALLLLLILHGFVAAWAMPRPPAGAIVTKKNGQEFFSGTVYVGSAADTATLKTLGFRELRFVSHSFHSFRYAALWAKSAVMHPTPECMNGLEYEAVPVKSEFEGSYVDKDGYPIAKPDSLSEGEMESLLTELLASPSGNSASSDLSYRGEPKPAENTGDRNVISMETSSDGRTSEAWFLHYPRPVDGKPDTTLNGKPYMRGSLYCSNLSDTSKLSDLGFMNLATVSGPSDLQTLTGARTSDEHLYWILSGFWPMKLATDDLPNSVPHIEIDPQRKAQGVFSKVHMPPLKPDEQ